MTDSKQQKKKCSRGREEQDSVKFAALSIHIEKERAGKNPTLSKCPWHLITYCPPGMSQKGWDRDSIPVREMNYDILRTDVGILPKMQTKLFILGCEHLNS